MTITISENEALSIASAVDGIHVTENQILKAYHVCIGRAVQRSARRVVREISTRLDIPLKIMRRRLKIYSVASSKDVRKVWFGLDGVPLGRLGKARTVGSNVNIRNTTIHNAYVLHNGAVVKRGHGIAKQDIDKQAAQLLTSLLPYYFYQYFEKSFTDLLKFKYGIK